MTIKGLDKEKTKHQSLTDWYVKELNNSETEAVKQLIFVATVFLTASLFVLQSNNTDILQNSIYKTLLILSWLAFGTSLGSGIAIFLSDRKFFEAGYTDNKKIVNEIEKEKNLTQEQLDEFKAKIYSKSPEYTLDTYLIIQVISLTIGVLFLLIVSFGVIS